MATILGISAYYHDSAAALVLDGRIVAAAQEERFSRVKHDPRFPQQAIRYCLEEAGITLEDLDVVGFYEKPWLKFERIMTTALEVAPWGLLPFLKAAPLWLKQRLWLKEEIAGRLVGYRGDVLFAEHHESHAASAFYPSPFQEAAILTLDGVGEWSTASIGLGRGPTLDLQLVQQFPNSLGLLYSAFTAFCGFRVNSGEYKLMGLAPFGEPRFRNLILDELLDLRDDGSFRLNQRYFKYRESSRMTGRRFAKLMGGAPRIPEGPLTQREMDLAASIQQVTEEVVLRAARHVHKLTGQTRLCLAGGVALNCVANRRLQNEGPFKELWIQPAAGDAGGALGVALLLHHQHCHCARPLGKGNRDAQFGSLLGPRFSVDRIRNALEERGLCSVELDTTQVARLVAGYIANGDVVGLFAGRMEFGPRALGARSIVADARSPIMRSTLNQRIKFREDFRPFAPVVLAEHSSSWFELQALSPYMLFTATVAAEHRRTLTEVEATRRGLALLDVVRSDIPAVTHVDGTARVQTVDTNGATQLRAILEAFYTQTGCPVLLNTSLNVRGEPIVCTPEDALDCFLRTSMDHLLLENLLVSRNEQPCSILESMVKGPVALD